MSAGAFGTTYNIRFVPDDAAIRSRRCDGVEMLDDTMHGREQSRDFRGVWRGRKRCIIFVIVLFHALRQNVADDVEHLHLRSESVQDVGQRENQRRWGWAQVAGYESLLQCFEYKTQILKWGQRNWVTCNLMKTKRMKGDLSSFFNIFSVTQCAHKQLHHEACSF